MPKIELGDPDTKTPQMQSVQGLCHGCSEWNNCVFDLPRNGGFKGQGPRNVAYTLITDRVENSNGKEDFMPCKAFIGSMKDRMISGQVAAAQGRKGAEIVRLLPDRKHVTQGMYMGVNGKGEIIKPQRNQIDDLRRAGYAVNESDNTLAVDFIMVKFERTIPDYNAPRVTANSYSQEIAAREAELQQAEINDEAARWEERLADTPEAKKRGRPAKMKPEADDFEATSE